MGFLTRFIASGISDGATRDEALRAHLAKTMKRCEELCVSTRAMARENGCIRGEIGGWGGRAWTEDARAARARARVGERGGIVGSRRSRAGIGGTRARAGGREGDAGARVCARRANGRTDEACAPRRRKDNWDQPTKTDKHWLRDKARMVYVDSQHAVEHPGRRAPW